MGHFMMGDRLASLFIFIFLLARFLLLGMQLVWLGCFDCFSVVIFFFLPSRFLFFFMISCWKSHGVFKGDRKNKLLSSRHKQEDIHHTTRNATHTAHAISLRIMNITTSLRLFHYQSLHLPTSPFRNDGSYTWIVYTPNLTKSNFKPKKL